MTNIRTVEYTVVCHNNPHFSRYYIHAQQLVTAKVKVKAKRRGLPWESLSVESAAYILRQNEFTDYLLTLETADLMDSNPFINQVLTFTLAADVMAYWSDYSWINNMYN